MRGAVGSEQLELAVDSWQLAVGSWQLAASSGQLISVRAIFKTKHSELELMSFQHSKEAYQHIQTVQ